MQQLKDFQTSQLLHLIAQETTSYYKLIGSGASVEECTQCNDRIRAMRTELDSRRNPFENNFISRPLIPVPPEYTF